MKELPNVSDALKLVCIALDTLTLSHPLTAVPPQDCHVEAYQSDRGRHRRCEAMDSERRFPRKLAILRRMERFSRPQESSHSHHSVSPIFFTNRIRSYRRITRHRDATTHHRLFIQMLLYWSMLTHGHSGNGKTLTSEYSHSAEGWVDMIKANAQEYELGYESFFASYDWWRENHSLLHGAAIVDSVKFWITKEAGFNEDVIVEKQIFLHRCSKAMVEDLTRLLELTAQVLVSSLIPSIFCDVYSLTIRVIAGRKAEANSQQPFARSFSCVRTSQQRILSLASLILMRSP